ncbi:MAG: hypothetical protein KHX13_04780 [Acidaminococcus intestini]|uniref:DNA-directed RNA polymerase n=1 Tax=Acidaminococcus intestini TaxID=187327 RepID=A0A943EGE2_9FIRM|nr:hypothetical protein [Acidaminococcus intestini]
MNTFESSYEALVTKYGPKFLEELEIESKAKTQAEAKLRLNLEIQQMNGQAGSTKLGDRFTGHVWEDCRANVKDVVETTKHPSKTTQGVWRHTLENLLAVYQGKEDALVDLMTLQAITTLLSETLKYSETPISISVASVKIGKAIKAEADLEAFCQYEEARDKAWVRGSMIKGISDRVATSYKLSYFRNRANKENYQGLTLPVTDLEALGAKLIEAVVYGSGYWYMKPVQMKKKKVQCILPTSWLEEAWANNMDKLVSSAVQYLPMVVPPAPWTTPFDGGYYGASRLHTSLIRLHGAMGTEPSKRYSNMLQRVDLSRVYDALNALQDTPFVINSYILDVMTKIKNNGGDFGGIPRMEPMDLLPMLPEDATEEDLKAHKKKLVALYKAETARKSKALKFLMTLEVAKKYKDQDRIYFPWNIDYRGRCYPIPTALSPQGDDLGKALLLFAEGSPIKEEDWKWMAIHGANLAGHDKVPFETRIQWVLDNTSRILESAQDPLGHTWWYEASKNEYPMEFLAFCHEWEKLQAYYKNNGIHEGFVSTLPLAFDGTCSGLQHFSALLRDEVGGKAVNLVPSPSVQDIYSIVAEKVNKALTKDAESGNGDSPKIDKKTGEILRDSNGNPIMTYGSKTLAQNWAVFNRVKFGQDGITRKICKRSVMTLAYGSKQYGFKENILEDHLKPFVNAHPEDNPFVSPHQAAVYMAGLIWDAVGTTVIKAVEGMKWLQDVSKLICKNGEVVTWFTPNGLPVQQNYMKSTTEVIQVRFGGARVRLYSTKMLDEVDSRAQANGIAPNFIHSMDATHLQRVVVAEKTVGNNNFMMIHDSFGTDAAHAGHLYATIRQQFVSLYDGQNLLADFFDNVKHLISEEDMDAVPELPSFGNLHLQDVVSSQFCFA